MHCISKKNFFNIKSMHQCLCREIRVETFIHTEYLDVVHCKINQCGSNKRSASCNGWIDIIQPDWIDLITLC